MKIQPKATGRRRIRKRGGGINDEAMEQGRIQSRSGGVTGVV